MALPKVNLIRRQPTDLMYNDPDRWAEYYPEYDFATRSMVSTPTSIYDSWNRTTHVRDEPVTTEGPQSYSLYDPWTNPGTKSSNIYANSPIAVAGDKPPISYSTDWAYRSKDVVPANYEEFYGKKGIGNPTGKTISSSDARANQINDFFNDVGIFRTTSGLSSHAKAIVTLMAKDYGQSLSWANTQLQSGNMPGQRKSLIKYDMGGVPHYRTLEERSYGYDEDLRDRYRAGQITDHDLFYNQMYRNVQYDVDEIGSPMNYTSGLNAYARASITFGGSGRISFSNSFGSGGTSFRF